MSRSLTLLLTMLVVSPLLWFSPPAEAFSDLGHVCFQLAPFVDVLDLHVKQPDLTEPFFVLNALWRGEDGGVEVYRLEGGGSAYGDPVLGST